jgi:hypothetical protein
VNLKLSLNRLSTELALPGVAGLVLLAAAVAFSSFAVRPLQERSARLQESVSKAPAKVQPGADKVAAVYQFLEKPEDVTDWLAKLHAIGTATGVHLKSASYRTQPTESRIVRYEIVLPATGSYKQIRDFLKRSLAEIPVLSVDQLTLKRDDRNAGAIQAEMRLTLHMVRS